MTKKEELFLSGGRIYPDKLNYRQVCSLLNCSKTTFYRLIKKGKIKHYGGNYGHIWVLKKDILDILEEEYIESGKLAGSKEKGK